MASPFENSSAFALTIRPRGGLTPEMETAIVARFPHIIYSIEMDGESRHMHAGVLCGKNCRGLLLKALRRRWPSEFEFGVAIKCKTWYQGLLGEESNHTSWIDYLSKDGPATVKPDGFDFTPYLVPDVPKEERKTTASWPQMSRYRELFTAHDLPYSTIEEVGDGLEQLAFVFKVTSFPKQRDVVETTVYLYHYLNGSTGARWDLVEQSKVNVQKRKRIDDMIADTESLNKRAQLGRVHHPLIPLN